MKIALSRIHYPVRTLGPGARIGVWFQGCAIRCPGCVSMDTWAVGQHVTTLDEVKEGLLPFLASDGVTISGGEPFDQPEALLDSSLRDVKQDDSNNEVAASGGGEQIDDILDGLVGAVVGDFESAVWAILRVRTAVEAAVGKWSAQPFVEEQK